MKQIPLTNRDFPVLVSDCDYEFLSQFKWFAKASRSGDYACASVRMGKKVVTLRLHRVVANCWNDMVVDHVDTDHWNNQRENLETVSNEENIKRYYDLRGREVYKDIIPF